MKETYVLEDLLNTLVELESTGSAVYRRLRDEVADEDSKKLFAFLADQEDHHKKVYEDFLKELDFNVVLEDEYVHYLRVVLHNNMRLLRGKSVPADAREGLSYAIQLEKDTLVFLNEMINVLGHGKHDIIEKMMNEERNHLRLLYEISSI